MSKYRFSTLERAAIWEAHDKRCIYCSELIYFTDLHIDHILPEELVDKPDELDRIKDEYDLDSKFSINTYYNWVPGHSSCNLRKSNRKFKKNRLLFFLEIAESKYAQVKKNEQKRKETNKKDKILISLALGFEQRLLSFDEFLALSANLEKTQSVFKLLRELEFIDRVLSDSITKDEIDELLNLPVKLGTPDIDGLELVGQGNEKITVRTCREWREAKEKGYFALTTFAMKMESYFNHAYGIINAVSKATVADKSYISDSRIGVVDINLMPVSILPTISEEGQTLIKQAASSGTTVQDWVESGKVQIKSVSQYAIELEYSGMGGYLCELMPADFNQDGIEDILLYQYSYAIGGTFGYGSTMMVTRRGQSENFEIISEAE
jgi:5-methylcytosine-specific restriction endonuclease McrA